MTPNRKRFSCILVATVIFFMLVSDLECKSKSKAEKMLKKVSGKHSGSFSSQENVRLLVSRENNHKKAKMNRQQPEDESSKSSSFSTLKRIENDDSMPEKDTENYLSPETRHGSNVKRKKIKPKSAHDHGTQDSERSKNHSKLKAETDFTSKDSRSRLSDYGNRRSLTLKEKEVKSIESKTNKKSKSLKGIFETSSGLKEGGKDKSKPSNLVPSHDNNKESTERSKYMKGKGKEPTEQSSMNSKESLSSRRDTSSGTERTSKERSGGNSKNIRSWSENRKSDQKKINDIDLTTDHPSENERGDIFSENVLGTSTITTVYQRSVPNTKSATKVSSKASTVLVTAKPDKEDETADKVDTAPGIIIRQPYKGRKKCKDSTPPCCINGQIDINLGTINYMTRVKGDLDGVSAVVFPKPQRPHIRCSNGAEIKVSFDPMGNEGCFGCTQGPFCGRRLLQLDLELSRNRRRDTLLCISDSPLKDGGASVHALFPHVTIYPRNSTGNASKQVMIMGAMNALTNKVTVYIGNQFVRLTNDNRLDENFCMRDLFHLNGQYDVDNGGNSPNIVTIGINRRIPQYEDERSFGVCSATLKWACPWQDA